MHANLDCMSNIKLLLPPVLIAEYERLRFDIIESNLVTRFIHSCLLSIVIGYKSGTNIHVLQDDVTTLYCKIKRQTIVEGQCMYKMCDALDLHIFKSTETLRLYCDGCSCINKLEFNDTILKKLYRLHIRYDLVYKCISNIDFQKCHNVVDTIDNEINSVKLKLTNTCDKIVVMILGITDINSLITSLCNDVIGIFVYHLVYNIDDEWMTSKTRDIRCRRLLL